jgi:hypothetical protein
MSNQQSDFLGNMFFAALWISLFADIFLRTAWNKLYFTVGVPIFILRVPVKNPYQGIPYQYFFDEEFDSTWFDSLAFKAMDSRSYGFREKYFQPRLLKYIPVMHGLIVFEHEKQQVVVKGLANWFSIWLILYISLSKLNLLRDFPIDMSGPSFFIIVVFVILYLVQAWIFSKVGRLGAELCSDKYALTIVRV